MRGTLIGRFAGLASSMTLAAAVVLGGAAPASAGIAHEFAAFSTCPVEAIGDGVCVRSVVNGGEFVLGSKTVTINKTIVLQGGVAPDTTTLVPATDGNTLAKVPLTVPGGLVGIEGVGGEVTATAELAGSASVNATDLLEGHGQAAGLPLKVKLDNAALGSSCYVGSSAEPVALSLTTGTTKPPLPNKSISGNPGTLSIPADGNLVHVAGVSLVDNAFAAPGANGCGAVPLLFDPLVNNSAGLPAAAGTNTAIMDGYVEAVEAKKLRAQAKLPAVGHCVKAVPKESGFFEDSKCIEGIAGGGKYEWIEGPGANRKFTGTAGKTTLQGVSGGQVTCASSALAGEYTGAKSLTTSLSLAGCQRTSTKQPCETSGSESGKIVSGTLAGTLGFIKDQATETETLASVGVDLSETPSLLHAECGGVSEPLVVAGSVIAQLTKIDAMSSSNTLKFASSGGKQTPEAFEEQSKDTLTATLGSGAEQAGLAATQKITNEESLEIKAIQR
jgi:hypothetical protein